MINIKSNKISIFIFSMIFILFLSSTQAYATDVNEDNSSDVTKEKVVYLTFDDGPGGKVTKDILDTLKKEGVKATFFVIGSEIKGQESILLRMKDEGHSIGLHSFTHDRDKLYCSNQNFLNEMVKSQEAIYNVTGEKYYILRFPFGCNNKSYRLTQRLVDTLHENNFKIYDWNADSGDGANYKSSPESIAKKACKNEDNVVVLMHCGFINKTSAKALPSIIKYYKDNGYIFKTIDETTPEIYKVTKH